LIQERSGARVGKSFNVGDTEIADTRHMDSGAIGREVGAAEVAVQGDGAIAFGVFFNLGRWSNIEEAVGQGVGMAVAPNKRTRVLHDGQET
jgi:hypothetical protein